jgi:phenylpropionate dioxygenase-like ring-hydroxylating dioxygenase large terminal subunit
MSNGAKARRYKGDIMSATAVVEPPLSVPPQGVNGFNASWYPVCMSAELGVGAVRSEVFLHGRVVAWRDSAGVAHVTSPFCPHLGADLAQGTVVENRLRCVYHHWEFNGEGVCEKHPKGDVTPERAKLFAFPTRERWGLIWAFNGIEPLFELPDFKVPDDQLSWKVSIDPNDYPTDPYILYSNSCDFAHLEAVHGLVLLSAPEDMKVDSLKIEYDQLMRHALFGDMQQHVRIYGSNIFSLDGTMGPLRVLAISTGRPTSKGHCVNYSVALTISEGSEQEISDRLDMMAGFVHELVKDDTPIINSMRVRPGALTKSDFGLVKYFAYTRDFPRSDVAVPYITIDAE